MKFIYIKIRLAKMSVNGIIHLKTGEEFDVTIRDKELFNQLEHMYGKLFCFDNWTLKTPPERFCVTEYPNGYVEVIVKDRKETFCKWENDCLSPPPCNKKKRLF